MSGFLRRHGLAIGLVAATVVVAGAFWAIEIRAHGPGPCGFDPEKWGKDGAGDHSRHQAGLVAGCDEFIGAPKSEVYRWLGSNGHDRNEVRVTWDVSDGGVLNDNRVLWARFDDGRLAKLEVHDIDSPLFPGSYEDD